MGHKEIVFAVGGGDPHPPLIRVVMVICAELAWLLIFFFLTQYGKVGCWLSKAEISVSYVTRTIKCGS